MLIHIQAACHAQLPLVPGDLSQRAEQEVQAFAGNYIADEEQAQRAGFECPIADGLL